MHQLPSVSVFRKFRFASLFVVFAFLSIPLTLGLLVHGFLTDDFDWFFYAGLSLTLGLVCMGINLLGYSRLRCPLCMMPPLQSRRCVKNGNAGKLFGSHRLKVAKTILFNGHFRCPYCGEPTQMTVRQRKTPRRRAD